MAFVCPLACFFLELVLLGIERSGGVGAMMSISFLKEKLARALFPKLLTACGLAKNVNVVRFVDPTAPQKSCAATSLLLQFRLIILNCDRDSSIYNHIRLFSRIRTW